jgi:catechol 1,2-dioxygenase
MERAAIDAFLHHIESTEKAPGNPRAKLIINRLTRDLFYLIEDLDVQPDEFWTAMNFLTEAGRNGEYGLIAAGTGLEHFLDLRLDEAEAKAGVTGGTPRTIEGPLYVAGVPDSQGFARIDDGTETGGETLFMQGQVLTDKGQPLAGARVEVWHANLMGTYSHFDSSQSEFNLRGSIITDENGRYRFRSFIPVGYSVPPGGSTDQLLHALGRHGSRPAHIHFFVSAPNYRKLTTQINIEGDPLIWDDFAFATREGLVPHINHISDPQAMREHGVDKPFASIDFNFTLHHEQAGLPEDEVHRARAVASHA